MRSGRLFGPSLLIMACISVGVVAPNSAHSEEYTMYVGYGPGGSFDLQARVMARNMEAHLPDRPKVIVRFMPGAGTLTLARYLFTAAKRNGTEFGQINSGVVFSDLLFDTTSGVNFRSLTYLGSPARELSVCAVWHESKIKRIEDAKTMSASLSAVNPLTVNGATPTLVNRLIGTQFRPIFGYAGDSQQSLAMERGEVDGRCSSYSAITTTKPDWLRDQKLRFLVHGSPTVVSYLPDVPSVFNMISNQMDKAAAEIIFAKDEIGNPLVAPPNMSPENRNALISAFTKTMADPRFIADAKANGFLLDPVSGQQAQHIVQAVHSAPVEVISRARKLLAPD